ncbi:MAG: hypothetical protein QOE92_566 [Chloroflexota bacterium]|nr:hypothetical protein [Chloroflexota bacterium]
MARFVEGLTVRRAAVAATALLLGALALGQAPVPAQARICINDKICPSPGLDASPSPSTEPPTEAPPEAPPAAEAPPPEPPPAEAAPPPLPSPSAAAQLVKARFQNAPFLADLLKVLEHPASQEQPDLRHFRPAAAGLAAGSGTDGSSSSPGAGPWELALAAVTWTTAIAVALALGQRRRLRLRRLRRAAQLGLLPVVAVMLIGLRGGAGDTPVRPALPRVAAAFGPGITDSTASLDNLDPLRRSRVPSAPAWNELVRIEAEVAHHQDTLVEQEREIQALATTTDASPGASPGPSPLPTASAGVHADLATLLASHDATAEAYHEALRQEYDLYVHVARTPGLAEQLLAAAGEVHSDGADAISYNLGRVQTQLAQEDAIAAAEAKLAAIGSLSSAQLAAMRHHQAFIIPMQAPITQGFGPTDVWFEPPSTYHGVFHPHFHSGIDFAAPEDTPVHAAADGVVVLATASTDAEGKLVGYGNYVVVAHPDGFFTLYGHLNSLAVKEGRVIHQGEIVGKEGSTGLSTGPHVHFEIRKGDELMDPAPYLAGQIPA